MRAAWVALVILTATVGGCMGGEEPAPPEAGPESPVDERRGDGPTPGPSGDTAETENGESFVTTILLVDYGAYPNKQNEEAEVRIDTDAKPSAELLHEYDRDHPPHLTALDVLVAWANETGTPLAFEPDAPIVKEIDGAGQPVDSQLPPWWCYELNDGKMDVSSSEQQVVEGDRVRFFLGDCDATQP